MKLICSVLFSLLAATAMAQRNNAEIQKLFDKNKLLLEKVNVHSPALMPVITVPETSTVHNLRQDNMPCIVPDTKAVVPMPNALPELNIPDVAAIPNPALKNHMGVLKSFDAAPGK